MRRPAVLFALALIAACTVHSGSRRSVYRTTLSVPAEGVNAITVSNNLGSVRFVNADDGKVTVDLDVLLDESRPETDAVKVVESHLRVLQTGDQLELRDAHLGDHDREDWELRLVVHTPSGRALRVEQSAGAVDVDIAQCSTLSARCGNGTIQTRVGTVVGALDLHVETGQVDATVTAEARGGGGLGVGNGQASLALPEHHKGVFDLAVTTGGLRVAPRFGLDVVRGTVGGKAHGSVGEGGPSFRIEVGTGELVLK
ncbi:MAG: hypothetical protein U1F36_13485 [Planctomycetota bacterium]